MYGDANASIEKKSMGGEMGFQFLVRPHHLLYQGNILHEHTYDWIVYFRGVGPYDQVVCVCVCVFCFVFFFFVFFLTTCERFLFCKSYVKRQHICKGNLIAC